MTSNTFEISLRLLSTKCEKHRCNLVLCAIVGC
uniref:Uncharacterized protein n=1 Tax=Anguilla anguilla TaxID=7936 RepID=A0A0E9WBR0_ANGAN